MIVSDFDGKGFIVSGKILRRKFEAIGKKIADHLNICLLFPIQNRNARNEGDF